jgi:hypothetical protein
MPLKINMQPGQGQRLADPAAGAQQKPHQVGKIGGLGVRTLGVCGFASAATS